MNGYTKMKSFLSTAAFIMACSAPFGRDNQNGIWDLCWLDNVTLIMVQSLGNQVLRVIVDTNRKTCTYKVIDSQRGPLSMSCSPDGLAYARVKTSIWLYDKSGPRLEWKPENCPEPFTTAVNSDRIVVGPLRLGPVAVYDKSRNFLYNVSIHGDKERILYSHLTNGGLFLGTTRTFSNELFILNLRDNTSVIVGGLGQRDGQFHGPAHVSSTQDEFILVCDWQNKRVSVFSPAGQFLNHLQFDYPSSISPYTISIISRSAKPSLMAIGDASNRFSVYSLT